ncbi:GNAT family N-acetyltransferase [Chitinophaga qingshengii]|uniref:GNAT family N-acetyltransferase n=1 Tax=Chitinophaga qingshengii TaxID=1569794 RepID=A0ABR7TPB5_9BACT|nr:GNAT family N-acetyltransferase [Chitinophaga qingshengii]MBC9932311.1 GNAT family N-acetyltransferase [Chitinophaga qingshengii]
MEFNLDLIIETKSLVLKVVHEKYIDEINSNFTKEVTKYMPFNPSGKRKEVENFVEISLTNFKRKTDIVFVIVDKNDVFIGCCGIHDINLKSVELGLWLKEDSQSKGFGAEIINGLINFVEKNIEIDYIIYPVDKENIRSRKIPEKLGFKEYETYTKQKDDSTDLNIIEYRKYYRD